MRHQGIYRESMIKKFGNPCFSSMIFHYSTSIQQSGTNTDSNQALILTRAIFTPMTNCATNIHPYFGLRVFYSSTVHMKN
ncbi:hypothetical protein T09_266 [Trichinella sp. T9]|nr:hypothetical protein T09_266 [Trichinella sp. T9]